MSYQLNVAFLVSMLSLSSLSFACERLPVSSLALFNSVASPCDDSPNSTDKGMQPSQIRPL